ncbi:MAG TPA: hypothetical protein VG433_15110, partial [Pirellulales bacterium]|nr:hypothetical protein [Pirellulales bacterium]
MRRARLLLVAIILSVWPVAAMAVDFKEKEAIAALEKLQARFIYDEENADKPLIGVDLDATRVTDSTLQPIENLPKLKIVLLGNSKISDAGLKYLKKLSDLEKLWLPSTKVTDAGLTYLKGLSKLSAISLYKTKVTDTGMAKLSELP